MTITDWLQDQEKEEVLLIKDVATHGCQGGVPGITYYNETAAFHDKHEEEIWDIINDTAEDSGETPMQVVARVAPLAGVMISLKNYLVWFAVEVRAQQHLDAAESSEDAGNPVQQAEA